MSVKLNLLKNSIAQGVAQAIFIFTQLVVPPLLIGSIGLQGLGVHIAAQSVALFFIIYELGIIQSLQTHLLLKSGSLEGAHERGVVEYSVQVLYRRLIWILVLCFFTSFALFCVPNIYFNQFHTVISLAILNVIITIQFAAPSIASVLLTINNREPAGVMLALITRLIDVVIIVIGCGALKDLVLATAFAVIVRTIMTVIIICKIKSYLKNKSKAAEASSNNQAIVAMGYKYSSQTISSIIFPNILPSILLPVLGAPELAIFTVARTLSRAPVQLSSVLLSTVSSTISRAFSAGNKTQLKNTSKILIISTLGLVIIFSCMTTIYLEEIQRFWLKGASGISEKLYIPLAVSAISAALINTTAGIRAACGDLTTHVRMAIALPLMSIIFVLPLSIIYGAEGAALGVLLAEGLGAAILVILNKKRP
jgi:O-antigen/teichoic acid export membrane protein